MSSTEATCFGVVVAHRRSRHANDQLSGSWRLKDGPPSRDYSDAPRSALLSAEAHLRLDDVLVVSNSALKDDSVGELLLCLKLQKNGRFVAKNDPDL